MGGHSTSYDPTRYVPKEELEHWAKRDPVERFERFLERRGIAGERQRAEILSAVREEIDAAVREAEATAAPGLETIFSDVYAELPSHLRRQGEFLFDLARRRGDAVAGDGSFPL